MDIIIWVGLAVGFLAAEGYALWNAKDGFRPLTYHVRNLMRYPAVLLALFGGWLWLGYHFFVERWPWRRQAPS